MQKNRITVVIPSYKSEGSIKKAIESAIEQGEVVERIIVVEDGVYDNTGNVVESIDDSRVELVSFDTNKGAQKARNKGLELVNSKYVIFLDSDDFFEGFFLDGLIKQAELNNAGICFGVNCRVLSDGEKSYFKMPSNKKSFDLLCGWVLSTTAVGPTCILWSTSLCREVGGWDETVVRNQDGEIIIRALIRDCNIAYSEQGAGCTVQHSGFRISKIRTLESFMSQEVIYENVNSFLNDTKLTLEQNKKLRAALNWFCTNICIGLSEAGFAGKEYSSWKRKINWHLPHFLLLPKDKAVQVLIFYCFGKKTHSVKNILKRIMAR